MKKIKIVFILLSLLLIACEDKEEVNKPDENGITLPQKEMRAVWMATVGRVDWPASSNAETQKQQYINYLETFVQHNINTVIVQIRPMADSFYPSALEPWSEYITGTQGKDPGYDVLQFMIDETHKRGLEFHAWLNPYRISSNAPAFKPADGHIIKTHPEWGMTYDKLLIFRPALPEVREHFVKVIDDIITKYDVDGIHFDDYFYPYPVTGVALDDEGDFVKYGSEYASIQDFRRGNVNKVIEAVSDLIKKKRPDVLFSISPYAVWRNKTVDPQGSSTSSLSNYDDLYADIRLWCEKGWIDYVVPQLYASTENVAANFITLADWWPKNSFDVPVLAGIALYKFGVAAEGAIFQDPLELETQFFYARRQKKIAGSVLYNANAFTANRISIIATLDKMYSTPALAPFMGRKTQLDPAPASNMQVTSGLLTWNATGDGLRYAVYKINGNKGTLVAVTTDKSYQLTEGGDYMVSVVNEDNTESALSAKVTYTN